MWKLKAVGCDGLGFPVDENLRPIYEWSSWLKDIGHPYETLEFAESAATHYLAKELLIKDDPMMMDKIVIEGPNGERVEWEIRENGFERSPQ